MVSVQHPSGRPQVIVKPVTVGSMTRARGSLGGLRLGSGRDNSAPVRDVDSVVRADLLLVLGAHESPGRPVGVGRLHKGAPIACALETVPYRRPFQLSLMPWGTASALTSVGTAMVLWNSQSGPGTPRGRRPTL